MTSRVIWLAIGFVLGAAAAWLVGGRFDPAPRDADESNRTLARRDARIADLEAALARDRSRHPPAAHSPMAGTTGEPSDTRTTAIDGSSHATEGAARASSSTTPRLIATGPHDSLLDEVDWHALAIHARAIPPLAARVASEVILNGTPSLDVQELISRHNVPLLRIMAPLGNRLPGTGLNGSVTHPAFQANAIVATLAAAGRPLGEAQLASLSRLTTDFSIRDIRRQDQYSDGEFELHTIAAEAALRRAFFDRAFELLDTEQIDVLRPEAVRGRVGLDFFSTGLFWSRLAMPMRHTTDDGFIAAVTGELTRALGLVGESRGLVDEIVTAWATDLSETRFAEADPLDRLGFVRTAAVERAVEDTVRLFELLVHDAALSEATLSRLRSIRAVYVPVRYAL